MRENTKYSTQKLLRVLGRDSIEGVSVYPHESKLLPTLVLSCSLAVFTFPNLGLLETFVVFLSICQGFFNWLVCNPIAFLAKVQKKGLGFNSK